MTRSRRIRLTGGPWAFRLSDGHHQREECLTRPGLWCQGIGNHTDICAVCPTKQWEDK